MKLLTRCISALLFMGISLMLNASVNPTVSIRSQKDQSFSVHLKDIKNETYNIQLTDENGYILLSEKVEDQTDYIKLFNLGKLSTGNYRLKIENDRKIFLQNINVQNQRVSIDSATKKEIDKPILTYESSHLDLNMENFGDGPIRMRIWDEENNLVFEEEISKKRIISKRYDLTALPEGNYLVYIDTEHYTVKQEFSNAAENKIISKPSNDKRKLLGKQVAETKQQLLPNYVKQAINSRIKWLNGQND